MWRAWRFAVVLVAGLGLLTWLAMLAVNETTARWFEKDMALRADLAVNGSRRAILFYLAQKEWKELRSLLLEVTHDERILGAAACTTELKLVARTPEFPERFKCGEVASNLQPGGDAPPGSAIVERQIFHGDPGGASPPG